MRTIDLLLINLRHLNENPHTNYEIKEYRPDEYLIKVEGQDLIENLYSFCRIFNLTISPGDKWEFIVG